MKHNRIRVQLGAAVVAVALTTGVAAQAGAAPSTGRQVAAVVAAASPGQRVNPTDLVTTAQVQRALDASALGGAKLKIARTRPSPLTVDGLHGSPYFHGMFEFTASDSVFHSAVRRPLDGYSVQQKSWVFSTPTGASRAMTRQLGYLRSIRPNGTWGEAAAMKVSRVAGVGNDAYWLDLLVPGGVDSVLYFRQGNILTLFSTRQSVNDRFTETRHSTVVLARELAASQRVAHSGSPATAAVLDLGRHPIRIGTAF